MTCGAWGAGSVPSPKPLFCRRDQFDSEQFEKAPLKLGIGRQASSPSDSSFYQAARSTARLTGGD